MIERVRVGTGRPAELLERARIATGLHDFGEDSFRDGLERLVGALDREARLTETGAAAFAGQIVHFLSQRLQVEGWYHRHPEIDDEQIIAPLIGLGLPRTGSTVMSFLLGQDLHARSLRSWESTSPCPPPTVQTADTDPRIEATRATLERRNAAFPRMRAMFPADPNGPTECQALMAMDFKSQIFQALARVPSYAEWLNRDADLEPTYRFHKRVLKLLQWRYPTERWRLKSPSHIVFIDDLNTVYPDARFWMTHRDVASVVPSSADLYCELAHGFSDDVDPLYAGQLNADVWEIGLHRLIAFRAAGNDHRFLDAMFTEMQADPFPTLERLYAFTGEALTPETRARMAAWRAATPRERHGEPRYGLADFGLDDDALRARFRFYNERFGLLSPA